MSKLSSGSRAYDKLNVHKELEAIANWADANVQRSRKVNGPRFVVNWLKRANDSGGSPFAKQDKAQRWIKLALEIWTWMMS